MKVTVLGIGPGNPALLTAQAKAAAEDCRLLVGAPRMLAVFADLQKPCAEAVTPEQIAARVLAEPAGPIAVVVSGDVGFFSAAEKLRRLLADCEVECCCGISSLQYFTAKLCLSWEDIYTVSLHGRTGEPVGAVRANRRVFFLTGGAWKVQEICRCLLEAGLGDCPAWAGEHLSYENERIVHATVRTLAQETFDNLAVLLVENPRPLTPSGVSGLPDDAFLRGKVPMTKSEVRATVLSKLRPCNGETLYDVGAGTGSVSVELALQNPAGIVWAIERKDDACALIAQNRNRFALQNLRITKGTAPDALDVLPPPDAAFIGGSSGNLPEIVACLLAKNPAVRLVIAAVTLETVSTALACAKRFALTELEIVQIAVSRAELAGNAHLMRAQNPVTLLSMRGSGR